MVLLSPVDLLFIHHTIPTSYYITPTPAVASGVNGGSYTYKKYIPNYSVESTKVEFPTEIRPLEMQGLKERIIDLIFKEFDTEFITKNTMNLYPTLIKKELNAKHLVPLYEMLIETRLKNV